MGKNYTQRQITLQLDSLHHFNSSQVKYFNVNEMTHRTVTKKTYLAEFFFFQSPQCRHVAAVTLPAQSRVHRR